MSDGGDIAWWSPGTATTMPKSVSRSYSKTVNHGSAICRRPKHRHDSDEEQA